MPQISNTILPFVNGSFEGLDEQDIEILYWCKEEDIKNIVFNIFKLKEAGL